MNKLITLVVLALAMNTHAQTFNSGPDRVAMLELYTSEGCSSCPPADEWLAELRQHPQLWTGLIPVAFHVDYWDYIGWPDRFAKKRYSQRQRDLARVNRMNTVYTPGMMLNGREWRGFFSRQQLELPQGEMPGELTVSLNGDQVSAEFTPKGSTDTGLQLHIAVLGFDLDSDIGAGENRGRTLKHDFVVLGHRRVALEPSGNGLGSEPVALPELSVDSQQKALAVWVSDRKDPTPLQATGGWIEQTGG